MADIDLATALNMFKSGTQDLMFSRALDNANEQVQQIKATEANDQQQRAALQQIANGLTMRMAQIGVPATTMQNVSGAIAGPQLQNANQMAAWANQTGNSQLLDSATRQQTFEQNPAAKIAQIQARASVQNPINQAIAEEKKKEFAINKFKDFGKDLDQTAASSRSSFGVAGITDQRAQRLTALIGSPENVAQATDQDMTLLAEGLANMVKNGVATEKEIESLVPKTSGSLIARTKQYLTNNPEPAQRQGFIEKYQGLINREKEQADKFIVNTILRRATANLKIQKLDPDQFKLTVAESLRSANGQEISPDDIIVEQGKPVRLKTTAKKTSTNNTMIPVMVKGPDGRPMKALKDSVTGKLYAAPR